MHPEALAPQMRMSKGQGKRYSLDFCRKDHWSNGKLHHDRYVRHTNKEHDEWHYKLDAEKEALVSFRSEIEALRVQHLQLQLKR